MTAQRKPTEGIPAEAQAVVDFWTEAGPARWFAKDPEFDARFRDRFLAAYEAAARGELAGWAGFADGALAQVILLDQFPRNAFRGTPRMYATDALAREAADAAIARRSRSRASRRRCGFFSVCRSAIRKLWPTRTAASRSPKAWVSPARAARSTTARSCAGSAASRTATRSSDAR